MLLSSWKICPTFRKKIMKAILLFVTFCFLGSPFCYAQDLTCQDFKEGRFYIPKEELITKYHFTNNDSVLMISNTIEQIADYIIERKSNKQKEYSVQRQSGNDEATIEWLNDCTYRLTYKIDKKEKNGWKYWVNANGGILVEMVSIRKRCMTYQATLTNKEGDKMVQDGVICKE